MYVFGKYILKHIFSVHGVGHLMKADMLWSILNELFLKCELLFGVIVVLLHYNFNDSGKD